MAATEVRTESAAAGSHLRYRPHLDGLRTFAVYLVVAYHAGLGRFRGGFIGVDIFFVLSGYLVTSILFRDLVASGGVSFSRFYSRRVRRIIPAALVTLIVTAVAYYVVAAPADAYQALGGFRAAGAFVANWFFIRESTDYFASNVALHPVLHFWSLAVEEQFYLVWPLLLGALFVVSRRAGRRRWWVLRIAVAALALASAIDAVHTGGTNLDRAYYGTDTRMYQLLAGAFLALTPQLFRLSERPRRVLRVAATPLLLVLLVLASTAFSMSPITRGLVVAVAAALLIVALETAAAGAARRVLSARPIAYLGRVSYGTYLWQWPVIVLLTYRHDISPLPLFAITVVIATVLAMVSFHALERPIRMSRYVERRRAPVIVVGFATSFLVALVLLPAILGGGTGSALDWRAAFSDIPKLPDCLDAPVSKCTLVRGSRGRMLLMGDSVARMWIPTFEKIARDHSLTLAVASRQGCPWQNGLSYQGRPVTVAECRRHRTDWYRRVVSSVRPDVIVLGQRGYDDPLAPSKFLLADGRHVDSTSPGYESSLEYATARSLRALRARGRKLVILDSPTPPKSFQPLRCISSGSRASACGFDATVPFTPLERYLRTLAADEPDVALLDLDHVVCPRFPRCDAAVGDTIAWRDIAHITATYAASLTPEVDALLRRESILRP
jgi:peptidoglycan/LPS O-acetylase OafA/YrhL